MSHRTPPAKTRKEVSEILNSQLKLYFLSAGAVGVTLMALAEPAAAEIVYTQTHRILPVSIYAEYLDLNGDGIPDVTFFHYTSGVSYSQNGVIEIDARKNPVVGIDVRYAEPLSDGALIGSSANLRSGVLAMAHYRVLDVARKHYQIGPWNNVQNRYLGISFKIGAETHYGWVRVSVSDQTVSLNVLITGYAYETEANKSIRAGQTSDGEENAEVGNDSARPADLDPATLGALAAGYNGLNLWRREPQEIIQ